MLSNLSTFCGSSRHSSLMHDERSDGKFGGSNAQAHGVEFGGSNARAHSGEKGYEGLPQVKSKCTQICGTNSNSLGSRSCAKVVLVDVFHQADRSRRLRTYAILDEQSNRSLAHPDLFETLGLVGDPIEYTLNSCSGPNIVCGRKAFNCVVEATDCSAVYHLPPLLECSHIPNAREEIPTPEVAAYFPHLQSITPKIPRLDNDAEILLLIGRDVGAAHHIHEQIIGPDDAPFAQRLGLGWVIIGQVCLGQMHMDNIVNCNKTYLLQDGRSSMFPPCENNFNVKEHPDSSYSEESLFVRRKDDNKIGLSVEDREFLVIMNNKMKKDPCGNWVAPSLFVHLDQSYQTIGHKLLEGLPCCRHPS